MVKHGHNFAFYSLMIDKNFVPTIAVFPLVTYQKKFSLWCIVLCQVAVLCVFYFARTCEKTTSSGNIISIDIFPIFKILSIEATTGQRKYAAFLCGSAT